MAELVTQVQVGGDVLGLDRPGFCGGHAFHPLPDGSSAT